MGCTGSSLRVSRGARKPPSSSTSGPLMKPHSLSQSVWGACVCLSHGCCAGVPRAEACLGGGWRAVSLRARHRGPGRGAAGVRGGGQDVRGHQLLRPARQVPPTTHHPTPPPPPPQAHRRARHPVHALCVVSGWALWWFLHRCVVMVGLPYPDRSDPELQHKLAFIDSLASSSSSKQAGRWPPPPPPSSVPAFALLSGPCSGLASSSSS